MNKYFYLRPTNSIKAKGGELSLSKQAYLIWNKIRIQGRKNIISVEGNGKLRRCKVSIKGDGNTIIIKDNVDISYSYLEIVGNNCQIIIGVNTDIGGAYLSSKGDGTSLIIGNNCMLSRDINIMTYDGHPIFDADSGLMLNPPRDITIGDHVWIAAKASILKGVSIQDGSIIAFGSIVTRDVGEKCIVAGSPAKKIKGNIKWEH